MVEAEFAGFGASGRNGGWLSALLPMSFEKMAENHGRDRAVALQRTMHDSVDEVARVTKEEGIDCHLAKGGYLNLARNEPQVRRVHELLDYYRKWSFGEEDYRWLTADEASARLNASNVLGAGYTPHCAAIHPARLVRGLAETVEKSGTTIYEKTRVVELGNRKVRCETGTVTADVDRAGHRGLHRSPARAAPNRRPDLLVDDRHRAAAGLLLRGGRLGAT